MMAGWLRGLKNSPHDCLYSRMASDSARKLAQRRRAMTMQSIMNRSLFANGSETARRPVKMSKGSKQTCDRS